MIIMYLKTGHAYRLQDGLSLAAVNDTLAANTGKFFEVPLAPAQPPWAGVSGMGSVQNLFIVPDSVSHFAVI